jgi:hypothetical protein
MDVCFYLATGRSLYLLSREDQPPFGVEGDQEPGILTGVPGRVCYAREVASVPWVFKPSDVLSASDEYYQIHTFVGLDARLLGIRPAKAQSLMDSLQRGVRVKDICAVPIGRADLSQVHHGSGATLHLLPQRS